MTPVLCNHCGSTVELENPVCSRCGTPVPASEKAASPGADEDATLFQPPEQTAWAGGADEDATLFQPPEQTAGADGADEELTRVGTYDEPQEETAQPSGPLEVGQPFGSRYQILKVLGVGGMGAVYQAWDQELGLAVALKVIRTEATTDEMAEELSARFKRELLLAREVTHKNVVRIHDLGDLEGMKYFTMSFVEGEDLASVMDREGKLSPARALPIFRQVVDGMIAAHEKGIVHRDLKPANVMIDGEGNALLMDFGIARSAGPAAGPAQQISGPEMADLVASEPDLGQTMAGSIIGTFEYMAPEQFRGEVADQRADIYGLGLILYDMLVGRHRAKSGKSAVAEVMGRVEEAPEAPHLIDQTIPVGLSAVIQRCIDPDLEKRFQSTSELQAALDSLDDQGQPLPRFTRRSVFLAAGLTIAVIGTLIATYFLASGSRIVEEPDPVSVLVGDLDNRTGETVFGDALEQAVAVGLEGASFINIYPRGRARSRAEAIRPGAEGLDSELAQLVAQSEGIGVVVGGSIDSRGSGYEIALQAIDSSTGELLGKQRRRAGSLDDVLPRVGELVVRLRQRLGDKVPDAAAAVEQEAFTAGSLEAAQSYARAQDLMAVGSWQEAVPLYRRALELDPEFGRAYAGLGASYFNLGRAEEAEESYQQALAHIDRMTERERYRTRGGYYLRTGNWQKAVEELQSLADNYPADEGGLSNLALAHFFARDFEAALDRGRQAVETYPGNTLSRGNLALYAMYASDFETAEAEAREVLSANPAYETAYVALAMAAVDRGDFTAAASHYETLGTVSPRGAAIANLGAADLALFRGDLDSAATILAEGIAADRAADQAGSVQIKQVGLASTLDLLGIERRSLQLLEEALAATSRDRVRFEAALVHLRAGRPTRALEIASTLEAGGTTESLALALVVEGESALRRGEPRTAIERFESAKERADSWLARYGLGRAYLETDAFAEAHSELDRCFNRRGEAASIFFDDLPSYHYLPPLNYYLGRALEGLGSGGAGEQYRTFLELRGDGHETALVSDARARLEALEAGDGASQLSR